jgi:integrase
MPPPGPVVVLVGLQWQDIDWLGGELTLHRAVVKQITGEVRTIHSPKPLSLDARLLDVLKAHKLRSEFTQPSDWGSPRPIRAESYDALTLASAKNGESVSGCWNCAWLDELGTPISVQQRAMRHGDIRVTMNVYGDPVNDALRDASSKVAERVMSQSLTKSVS